MKLADVLGGYPSQSMGDGTHVEELNVVKDMVVVSKVVGGDDVDASILLDLPVGETKPLALSEEIGLGKLVTPVGLVRLLEITEDTDSASGSRG